MVRGERQATGRVAGAMAVQVMAWVFEHAPKDLKPSEMLVALVLADHANPEGGLAYPSVPRMARMTRLGERTVQGALQSLAAQGVIKRHMAANGPRPDVYCFPAFRGAGSAGVADARGAGSAGVDPDVTPAKNDILPPQILRKSGLTPIKEPSKEPLVPPLPPEGFVLADEDQAFDAFWAHVLRKEPSRRKAREAWDKARKKATAADILDGLLRWIRVWEQLEDETKVPHITTWLNQERWTVDSPAAPGVRPQRRVHEEPAQPTEAELAEAAQRRAAWQQRREEDVRLQREADEAARASALAAAEQDPQRAPWIKAETWAGMSDRQRAEFWQGR